ncbi:5'-methylthioadenosine/adenosylhomocysteine nucleosidase [Flavobacterium litorale]|uniref:adenosylhomocysteine nucleosidase n=2 Tax=Flavobacterium litorale TaxID=2856519 RepID=A0ABX8V9J0_9FLAO|nr:5'-methylthioadenosine/adenosylhomocysteine nucleosidase [Flavobacterium litorale]
MGAMPEEIEDVVALLSNPVTKIIGMRRYTYGTINGVKTVVVFSRWGKVAASATAATLVNVFNITELIFTGVAGGISPELKIGDIVIGTKLIQHDIDARPLMQQFEVPLLGKTYFDAPTIQLNKAQKAVTTLIDESGIHKVINTTTLSKFDISTPTLHTGIIASGDTFFASNTNKQALLKKLPEVLCVEMEGAAVAQVCYEYNIPFTVIRTISDTADDKSVTDFPEFIANVASKYTFSIITSLYASQYVIII